MSANDQSRHKERSGVGGERKLPQRDHQPIEVGGDDQFHLAARQRQHWPFWLACTIPPAPGPTATPAPAAPYTPLTSNGVRMLLTVPTKSVAEAPKVNP